MYRILTLLTLASAILCVEAQTQIVAHRGYWKAAQGAQNSLEAFNRADSIGVYGSEFDVWYTVDDRLVVNHDTKFHGLDMRSAPADSILDITLANGEKLPTLDAYLANAAQHPDIRLVLELKPLPDIVREDIAARKIVDLLHKYGLHTRTDIISFSINGCLAFVKVDPSLPVYYLDGDLTPKKLKALGLAGLDYHHSVITKHPEWIEQAHDLDLKVNVWTVDNPDDIARFRALGVDYITTNNPEEKAEQ